MKVNILFMDWFATFCCIGGDCPLTCCSSEWNIALTDEDIEKYKNMSHPFQREIMKWVDTKKRCMSTDAKSGKCGLLTEDGWCRLVLECGEAYLSKTCTNFPRSVKQFGDTLEANVEINCPVVAGYLLETDSIEFGFEETATKGEAEEIDYQIYDGLALARGELVELIQLLPGEFTAGKLYIIFCVLDKIKGLIRDKGNLNKENVAAILEPYAEESVIREIFTQCEEITGKYHQKAIILQNILLQFQVVIEKHLERLFLMDDKLQANLKIWTTDLETFSRELQDFSIYLKQTYPMMSEKFLIYSLFMNWIELETDKFGEKIYARVFELTLIQLFAMSIWKNEGGLDRERYQVVIAGVDRTFAHTQDFLDDISMEMFKLGKHSLANMLMFLI